MGFNWDVFKDRNTQVRGGTGVFTGPPAYVWISNQIGNTGVLTGFESVDNKTVCFVDVEPSPAPVYASTDKGANIFFTRLGNTTRILETPDAVEYIGARWGVTNS